MQGVVSNTLTLVPNAYYQVYLSTAVVISNSSEISNSNKKIVAIMEFIPTKQTLSALSTMDNHTNCHELYNPKAKTNAVCNLNIKYCINSDNGIFITFVNRTNKKWFEFVFFQFSIFIPSVPVNNGDISEIITGIDNCCSISYTN